jgi:hypothetical protein
MVRPSLLPFLCSILDRRANGEYFVMSRSLFLLVMWYERNFEPRTGVDACQASYRSIRYSLVFGALCVTWVFGDGDILRRFRARNLENGLNVNLFLTFV